MTRIARRALVHGRVQGVAFRHHTKVRARELGLVGWVRNLADGDVEVWLEGDEPPVRELSRWLETGPPAASVSGVDLETVAPAGFARFSVRFD